MYNKQKKVQLRLPDEPTRLFKPLNKKIKQPYLSSKYSTYTSNKSHKSSITRQPSFFQYIKDFLTSIFSSPSPSPTPKPASPVSPSNPLKSDEYPVLLDLSDPTQIINYLKSLSTSKEQISKKTLSKILPHLQEIVSLNAQYELTIKKIESAQKAKSALKSKSLSIPTQIKRFQKKSTQFSSSEHIPSPSQITNSSNSLNPSNSKNSEKLAKLKKINKTEIFENSISKIFSKVENKLNKNFNEAIKTVKKDINTINEKIENLMDKNLREEIPEIKSPKKNLELKKQNTQKLQAEELSYEKIKDIFNPSSNDQKHETNQESVKKIDFIKPAKITESEGFNDNKKIKIKEENLKDDKNIFAKETVSAPLFSFNSKKEENKNLFSFGNTNENNIKEDKIKEEQKKEGSLFNFGYNTNINTNTSNNTNNTDSTNKPIFTFPTPASNINDNANDNKEENKNLFSFGNQTNFNNEPLKFTETSFNNSLNNSGFGNSNQTQNQNNIDLFAGGQRDYGQGFNLFENQNNAGNTGNAGNLSGSLGGGFSLGKMGDDNSSNKGRRTIYRARRN